MTRTRGVTHKIMSAIKSKDTKPEKLLGKLLWAKGLRYRKHYTILGKPDFVIVSKKIAIFCDGDFWHGNNWKIRGLKSFKNELDGYSPYWRTKILRNIERDKKVNKELKKKGWTVIRIWESSLKSNPSRTIKQLTKDIKGIK